VHLAVDADELAARVEHHRRVVVDALGPPLEERAHQRHAVGGGRLGQRLAGGAGHGLGQVEVGRILALGEVARAEELRQTDEAGAAARGLLHPRQGPGQVCVRIVAAAHLHEADVQHVPHGPVGTPIPL
jgi:hypothetical protein